MSKFYKRKANYNPDISFPFWVSQNQQSEPSFYLQNPKLYIWSDQIKETREKTETLDRKFTRVMNKVTGQWELNKSRMGFVWRKKQSVKESRELEPEWSIINEEMKKKKIDNKYNKNFCEWICFVGGKKILEDFWWYDHELWSSC